MATVSTERTGAPNIFTQQVKTPPGSPITQKQMAPPSFAEIARSLWGDNSPHITINVPQEQALLQVVGPTMVLSRMVQDILEMMTIYMMTCQLNVMELWSAQPSSTITISKMLTDMPASEDALELEDWRWFQPPPSRSAQPSSTITISKMLTDMPASEDALELEDWGWLQPPPSGFTGLDTMFPHHWQLSALILCRMCFSEVFSPNRIVNKL